MNSTETARHHSSSTDDASSLNAAPLHDLAALAPDDPRRRFGAAVTTSADVMERIRPDQYDLPTPCDGMSVGELHEHLVMVLRRIVCAGRGDAVPTWPMDAADVARGDWLDAWNEAGAGLGDAWGDDVLERPTELPWGVFSGVEVLGVYTSELAVHTWDLAVATGISPHWDDDAVEFALVAIHQQLPTADRAPMWEATKAHLPADYPWRDPFGPAVPVGEHAPAIDRLVAWNGRDPSWTAA